MRNVLIYHKITEQHLNRLKAEFQQCSFYSCTNKGEMERYIDDAEILISFKCTEEMLKRADKLRWVQALSAGVDNFPLPEIKKKGILLTNGRGIHRIHMAEYAIGVLIMLARNFYAMKKNQDNKIWNTKVHQGEINGATLGILGLGSIGREIARRADLFGMRVIGSKGSLNAVPHVEKVYSQNNMEEIFSQSDYVINLLPGTKDTEKVIDKKYFDLMKEDACFINMGRGITVNEEDFIEALKSNKIRMGVSDVFHEEPLPQSSPLWGIENLVITPHICGQSDKYFDRALEIIEHNLKAFIGEGEFINIVNTEKGY